MLHMELIEVLDKSGENCSLSSITDEYHKMKVNVIALAFLLFSQKATSKMLERLLNRLLNIMLETYPGRVAMSPQTLEIYSVNVFSNLLKYLKFYQSLKKFLKVWSNISWYCLPYYSVVDPTPIPL